MPSAICPYCGCSLARLGISLKDATRWAYGREELAFCCQGCLDGFKEDPERYLAEIQDWIVCPGCLAEEPRALAVSIEHDAQRVYFCRCPCCVDDFLKRPNELLERLEA